MQVIFLYAGCHPAILIRAAPAPEEIGFSSVREGFICFHGSVRIQIILISVPGLPAGCDRSVFGQLPLSVHNNPLHIRYFRSTVKCIRAAVDLCRSVFVSTAPVAKITDFSCIVQSPLIASHGSVCIQIIFISIPGLPAGCNLSIFGQIPLSAFYNPLRSLQLAVIAKRIASAINSRLAALVSAAPAPEVIDRTIGINHPFIGFHRSIRIQIIPFSVPGLPAGLFCSVFVKIPGSGFFDPAGLSRSFYRLGGYCWEHTACGRGTYCKAQAKNYHR